jgi:hypothetical protein
MKTWHRAECHFLKTKNYTLIGYSNAFFVIFVFFLYNIIIIAGRGRFVGNTKKSSTMKTKLLFLFILICSIANAQSPNWLWANSSGASNDDLVKSITTDVRGNVYAAGSFSSDLIHFGPFTLINSGSGTYDMFIVKYDASGNVLWARSFGGSDSDYGSSVAIDTLGNIYVGGSFRSDYITFDTITLMNAGPPYSDFFLVKFDASGKVQWVNSSKNSLSSDATYSICTDKYGNVYLTGPYQSDRITIGSTTLVNYGAPTRDSYIVKYNPSGNVIWVRGIGGYDDDAVNSISTDADGNLVAGGYFFSPVLTFGGTTLTNSTPGTSDIFIAKYDSAGNVLWAKRAGGSDSDYGSSVTADNAGNVFMGGSFRSTSITFDTIKLTNTGPPYSDFCLVKYDASGNVIWANSSKNSTSSDATYSISADCFGNVFLTGPYQSDSITIGSTTLINNAAPNRNFYIVEYNSSGDVVWATGIGGSNDDAGYSICTDPEGNLVAGGYFTSPSLTFGETTLTNSDSGTIDLFVAKLKSTTRPISINGTESDQHMIIYPDPFITTTTILFDPELNNSELNIYDLFGQKLRTINHISGSKMQIARGNLTSGIYFVNITQDNKIIATGKVVITE